MLGILVMLLLRVGCQIEVILLCSTLDDWSWLDNWSEVCVDEDFWDLLLPLDLLTDLGLQDVALLRFSWGSIGQSSAMAILQRRINVFVGEMSMVDLGSGCHIRALCRRTEGIRGPLLLLVRRC